MSLDSFEDEAVPNLDHDDHRSRRRSRLGQDEEQPGDDSSETRPEKAATSATRLYYLIGILVICVLVLFVLVIGIGVALRRHRGPSSQQDEKVSPSPIVLKKPEESESFIPSLSPSKSVSPSLSWEPTVTPSPTYPVGTPEFEAYVSLLTTVLQDEFPELVDSSLLRNESAFQFKALDWLANNDTYLPETLSSDVLTALLTGEESGGRRLMPTDNDEDLLLSTMLERYIFAMVYYAMDGPNWIDQLSFLSNQSVCEWNVLASHAVLSSENTPIGVSCPNRTNIFGTRQDALEPKWFYLNGILSYANRTKPDVAWPLQGTLPSELFLLSNLSRILISLPDHAFSAPIPHHVGRLSDLETLILESWAHPSTLPTELGLLTKLRSLDLVGEAYTGTIPTEIGKWSNLETLRLTGVGLSGSIPSEIGGLTSLQTLVTIGERVVAFLVASGGDGTPQNFTFPKLAESDAGYLLNVTGTIPTEMGLLTNLDFLYWKGTNIQGPLPEELSTLKQLTVMGIVGNPNLDGTIPSALGDLPLLSHLNLDNNVLSGTIPSELGSLLGDSVFASLFLDLSNNQLTGLIPTNLVNSTTTDVNLSVQGNRLAAQNLDPILCDTGAVSYKTSINCAETKWENGTTTPAIHTCSCCAKCYAEDGFYFERCLSNSSASCMTCGFNRTESTCSECRYSALSDANYQPEGLQNTTEVTQETACGDQSCYWNESDSQCVNREA